MIPGDRTVLPFPCPCAPNSRSSKLLRRKLRSALRISELPVIVDLSHCETLNRDDIELLLDCAAQSAGRDTPIVVVAGSPVTQVLLEVVRISSLIPVFSSVEEALGYTKNGGMSRVERNQNAVEYLK
jgi:hypothetical protein